MNDATASPAEPPRTLVDLYRTCCHGGLVPKTGPWAWGTTLLHEHPELGEVRAVEIAMGIHASKTRRFFAEEGLYTLSGGGGVQKIVLLRGAVRGDDPRDA